MNTNNEIKEVNQPKGTKSDPIEVSDDDEDFDVNDEDVEDDDEGQVLDFSEMLQSFFTNDEGENVVEALGKISQELHMLNKTFSKMLKK